VCWFRRLFALRLTWRGVPATRKTTGGTQRWCCRTSRARRSYERTECAHACALRNCKSKDRGNGEADWSCLNRGFRWCTTRLVNGAQRRLVLVRCSLDGLYETASMSLHRLQLDPQLLESAAQVRTASLVRPVASFRLQKGHDTTVKPFQITRAPTRKPPSPLADLWRARLISSNRCLAR
jgi:hypothetical protein